MRRAPLICRTDLPHRQYINEKGWVEHDPEEIYANTLEVVKNLVEKAGINKNDLQSSESVTSVKQPWSGTAPQASRYTTQLYGSAQEALRFAKKSRKSEMRI